MNEETKKAQAAIALYDADRPAENDLFGRHVFANKVAGIIVGRPLGEPLVVSIVGEWGGGKSTVMGFIRRSLAQLSCGIAEFNPWRFGGEDVLLFELFAALVKAIDPELKVLTKWQSIKDGIASRIDSIKTVLGAAGDLNTPGLGSVAQGVVGAIASNLRTEIEQVRAQAIDYLNKSQRRIVVLLDDIDRLEVVEVLILFRLIKLTCDLPNTTFVLAMDEDHVSRIIGRRIDGDQATGRSYIEKIVNVRLALPAIPDYKIRLFSLRLLEAALDQSGEKLSSERKASCVLIFDDLCSKLISTPRKAKSLANSYRFALGLIPGQVDPGDLMVLEGIRLLRPGLHKAILKVIPSIMRGRTIEDYLEALQPNNEHKNKRKERTWIEIISSLGEISEGEREDVRNALQQWFPQLRSGYLAEEPDEWKKNKRICSKDYFWRYFSGIIQDDDVYDHVVTDWLAHVSLQNSNSQLELIEHLNSSYADSFISKMKIEIAELPAEVKKNLAYVLASMAHKMDVSGGDTLIGSHQLAMAHVAASAVSAVGSQSDVINAAVEVIQLSSSFSWSDAFSDSLPQFCNTRLSKDAEGNPVRDVSEVEQSLARKVLQDFEKLPPASDKEVFQKVWLIWRNLAGDDTRRRLTEMIARHPKLALAILAAGCSSYSSTTTDPRRCWRWDEKNGTSKLDEIVDVAAIKTALSGVLNEKPLKPHAQSLFDENYETLEEIGWRLIAPTG